MGGCSFLAKAIGARYKVEIMAHTNKIFLIPMTVLFGFIMGAMAIIAVGAQSGYITLAPASALQADRSATPGTDRLNAYSCKKGETKHILFGGIEDNYSTARLEPTHATPKDFEVYSKKVGRQGAITFDRLYDEPGVDKTLVEFLAFSGEIARGLFVIKSRSTVSFENDTFTLSVHHQDSDNIARIIPGVSYSFSNMNAAQGFWQDGDIVFAELSGLSRKGEYIFLEDHNAHRANRSVRIIIGDDRQVDFMGLAICQAPEENLGMTHYTNSFERSGNWINLSCFDGNGDGKCNPYIGDTSCAARLPLACFKEGLEPVPANFAPDDMKPSWSGGYVKLTAPVRGDRFKNQDNGHAFCRAEFGEQWRMANLGEGGSNDVFTAIGQAPDHQQVWVDSKTEIYSNCWALRPDYEEPDYTKSKQ